ncbi:MAG TPA: hypothetical protein VGA65_02155, partial [Hyphomicrobium sp.]
MVQIAAPRHTKARASEGAHPWLSPDVLAILGACLAYGLIEVATAPAEPIASGDAYAWVIFHPSRPSGYPLALWLFGVEATVLLQPIVYAAALAWLL